jgi:hypothetical protein
VARRELDRQIRLPVAGVYLRWSFEAPVSSMEWDLTVLADPASSVGIYLALAQGCIDGSTFYLGLQTDVAHPGHAQGAGKGLIFSTWWTFDAGATRLAPGGFRELGTHEGRFVGVRRPYPWVVGSYRVTLIRSEPASELNMSADWFDLYVQQTSFGATGHDRPDLVGTPTFIGGMAFPRLSPSTPATIEETTTSFMEVYSGARRWSDVPSWDVDLTAYGDGHPCARGEIEYPAFAFGHNRPMPNVDARHDAAICLVKVRYGGSTNRVDPARPWP